MRSQAAGRSSRRAPASRSPIAERSHASSPSAMTIRRYSSMIESARLVFVKTQEPLLERLERVGHEPQAAVLREVDRRRRLDVVEPREPFLETERRGGRQVEHVREVVDAHPSAHRFLVLVGAGLSATLQRNVARSVDIIYSGRMPEEGLEPPTRGL